MSLVNVCISGRLKPQGGGGSAGNTNKGDKDDADGPSFWDCTPPMGLRFMNWSRSVMVFTPTL